MRSPSPSHKAARRFPVSRTQQEFDSPDMESFCLLSASMPDPGAALRAEQDRREQAQRQTAFDFSNT